MPTSELPVAWWAFWLVAMAAVVFTGFCWWLLRAALREDRAQDPGEPGGAQHALPPRSEDAPR